jgi:hypothetical protein
MEAERDVGHSRAQHIAGGYEIVDCRHGRKNAGEERMQRAAIIGVIARAAVRMRASVMALVACLMAARVMTAGLMMTGMRDGVAVSHVS